MPQTPRNKWPNESPPPTLEEERVADDWMKYWHQVIPNKFGFVEKFNHGYPVLHAPEKFIRTLEIGAGLGAHFAHQALSEEQRRNYYAVELRENMADELQSRYPEVNVVVADCQERLPFDDHYFDRIIAIHVLEHLRNLPSAVVEMSRLLRPDGGLLNVVIPCEGGLVFGLGRRLTTKRIFEKRYGRPYLPLMKREHVNVPREILGELKKWFVVRHTEFFPFRIPSVHFNICIGLTLVTRR